ncbi:unnamed protein product [Rotaria sp. Silwood1]|nr:unnamed protein product [Rotaria sp. Silwood1]
MMIDIHTQLNLSEVQVVSLVQDLIPRYRLRADTDFACSNEDFIQTPRIDGSKFESLTNTQIRALLDYYVLSSDRISQMTKTYHDINAVTRMLEDRENDLQTAVSLGYTLLESNDSLRNQVSILEQDIEQTTEIVKQLKHDLLLKERLIRFYYDMDLDISPNESKQVDYQHYEHKIRNLEYENRELRAESVQLKLESENIEHQEQAIVDHFAHALANANSEIENLQEEICKKNEENLKQHDELMRLSYEMREIHRRLKELKKENDELKILLSVTGKTRHEYETKIEDLEKHYSECLSKLHKSQQEINSLQKDILPSSASSPMLDINSNQHHTLFLSPIEYANFMSFENSLKSELEEVREDPNQLCHSTINTNKKHSRRRAKCSQCDTDCESSISDSAFSDTESLSSNSSCRFCQQSSPIPIDESKSISSTSDRRLSRGISSRLRLVKRLEGSTMLKRWQELAEPSLCSCLESIPGVYTRAEILHEINEENEEDLITPQNELEDVTRLVIDCCQMSVNIFIKIFSVLPDLDMISITSLPSTVELFISDDNSQIFNLFLKNNKITKLSLRNISGVENVYLIIDLFPRVQFIALQRVSNVGLKLIIQSTLRRIKENNIRHSMTLCIITVEATNDKVEKLKTMIDSENLLETYQLYRRLDKFYLEWK